MAVRVLRAASFLVCLTVGVTWAATFGTIVHIRGHVSDIALDESRGLLYAANFTANRIEKVATATSSLGQPYFVGNQPSTLALSPDRRYLVIGHYANPSQPAPTLTIIDLVLAAPPKTITGLDSVLAVAFGNSQRALVVTNSSVQLLDPGSGDLQQLQLVDFDSRPLPVPWASFPPEIVRATTGVSGDGQVIYMLWDSCGVPTISGVMRYEISTGKLLSLSPPNSTNLQSNPPLGPLAVSVDGTGSTFVGGYALFNFSRFNFQAPMVDLANFPYPSGNVDIGSHAYDWRRNLIYAQAPVRVGEVQSACLNPPSATEPPVLHIMDSDNLTVRERLQLKENLAGKSIISSDDQTMYSVSDSGVTVFPISSLGQTHRVIASQEDVVFQASGGICDRKVISHEIDIVNPGGGATDFTLSTSAAQGVVISPVSGTTPARVRIDVDSSVFHDQKGTVVVPLQISSVKAINIPPPVRLLINTRDPDQQGTIFNVPGKIVDVLADPVRNRFYVIRQDKNLVLIFDGTSFKQIGALRTGNTPVQMAITQDWKYLIVGNDNSQIASVFNLQTLLPSQPIEFPAGYYPRSVAVSSRAILATSRTGLDNPPTTPAIGQPPCVIPHCGQVHRIDMNARTAPTPDDLGIYINQISIDSALSASPSHGVIFMPMPDGTVALYEALADTFVASRKDVDKLGGAYAAMSDDVFAVDTKLLDSALVPVGQLNLTGVTSGITTGDGLGLISSIPPAAVTGVMQRFTLGLFTLTRAVRTAESPLVVQSLSTPTVGQIGQTILPFTRTLTPLTNRQFFVMLSTSGFTAIPWRFDVPVITHPPKITAVTNAADQSPAVSSGGLILIDGANLSASSASSSEPPLATTLDGVCVEVNSVPIPLLQVSPTQVTAQVPFDVQGAANMVVENAGGVSPSFSFTVLSAAPAVFRTGTAGPQTGLPTVVLASDNSLVTLANPVHPKDWIVIYLTGLGTTSPQPNAGDASPFDPLAMVTQPVEVTLGRSALQLNYAGLSPGLVGVYQINAFVPFNIEEGVQVPLTITQGGQSTTILIRVVNP